MPDEAERHMTPDEAVEKIMAAMGKVIIACRRVKPGQTVQRFGDHPISKTLVYTRIASLEDWRRQVKILRAGGVKKVPDNPQRDGWQLWEAIEAHPLD